VSNRGKMCDRLHIYRIDVGSCSGTSTKLAAAGGEVTPGVRRCLASGGQVDADSNRRGCEGVRGSGRHPLAISSRLSTAGLAI
jgi:hypothetical protein